MESISHTAVEDLNSIRSDDENNDNGYSQQHQQNLLRNSRNDGENIQFVNSRRAEKVIRGGVEGIGACNDILNKSNLRHCLEEIEKKKEEVERELLMSKIEKEAKDLIIKSEFKEISNNIVQANENIEITTDTNKVDTEIATDTNEIDNCHGPKCDECHEVIKPEESENTKDNCEKNQNKEDLSSKKDITLLKMVEGNNKPKNTQNIEELDPCFIFSKEGTEIKVFMDSAAKIQFLVDALRYLECLKQVKK